MLPRKHGSFHCFLPAGRLASNGTQLLPPPPGRISDELVFRSCHFNEGWMVAMTLMILTKSPSILTPSGSATSVSLGPCKSPGPWSAPREPRFWAEGSMGCERLVLFCSQFSWGLLRRAHVGPTDSRCAACTSGPLASYVAGLSPDHRHSYSFHSFQPLNHWDGTFRNNISTHLPPPQLQLSLRSDLSLGGGDPGHSRPNPAVGATTE